jgi:hypothetical protein
MDGVLLQDERCALTGWKNGKVCFYGILKNKGFSERCAFTGVLKNKGISKNPLLMRDSQRCAFTGPLQCNGAYVFIDFTHLCW